MTPPSDLAGQRAVVLGLGLFGGGLGAARHLLRRGAHVTVTDLREADELAEPVAALAGTGAKLVLGGHRECDLHGADLVVPNPAVRPDSPWLALAREGGARVTTDVELFIEASPARAAVITGTQGKTSTATALHALCVSAGMSAHLAGNVGRSPLDLLDELRPDDVVVLELSSYQLEHLGPREEHAGAAEVVAITNVLVDHVERHGTRAAYAAAKRRALELLAPGGTALVPHRDPEVAAWAPPDERRLTFDLRGAPDAPLRLASGVFLLGEEELGREEDLRLAGPFQRENVLIALGAARRLGAAADRLAAAIPGLRGPAHRLEDLGLVAGRRVWDNGVSTTPDSTASALCAMERPCTLLCGGQPKALPLEAMLEAARQHAARAVVFGADAAPLAGALASAGIPVEAEPDLADAVARALATTPAGEALLFSPACASFDAFSNFEARAQAFRDALPATTPSTSGSAQ